MTIAAATEGFSNGNFAIFSCHDLSHGIERKVKACRFPVKNRRIRAGQNRRFGFQWPLNPPVDNVVGTVICRMEGGLQGGGPRVIFVVLRDAGACSFPRSLVLNKQWKAVMSDTEKVMEMIREHDVKFIDFRFTDPRGKWQHLAHHVHTISEDFLNEGVMFDGSSIAGWKAINESDMMLVPDCSTAVLDPFAAQTSLIVFCDVHEPLTGRPYARDPRSIEKKPSNTSSPPALATLPISGRRPNSSSSMMCVIRQR